MNLKNIYIGKTYDGKTHLFIKKYGYYAYERSYTYFIDLKTKKKYDLKDIVDGSLKSYIEYYGTKTRSKRKILKMFND